MAYTAVLMKDESFFFTSGYMAGENEDFLFKNVVPFEKSENGYSQADIIEGKIVSFYDILCVMLFDGNISCADCLKKAATNVENFLKMGNLIKEFAKGTEVEKK